MRFTGFLVMGVSGSGKTSVGQALAHHLGWVFIEGDDYHSPLNIKKMADGIPLTDDDRQPWLAFLHDRMLSMMEVGLHPILACSALKDKYRNQLLDGLDGIGIIYLKGTYKLIKERLSQRVNHYMKSKLLASQFEALEEPADALIIDIVQTVDEIVLGVIRECFKEDK